MRNHKHVTIFDKPYPMATQAEGIAVSEAVMDGHCNACGDIGRCSSSELFIPPASAWCMKRKAKILKSWGRTSHD